MTALTPLVKFRISLSFFIIALLLSGLTAFPLLSELRLLSYIMDWLSLSKELGVVQWIERIYLGLEDIYLKYPWVAYGTDWLAFGHIIIALFFIEPWLRPASSKGNLLVGIAACILVIPLAMICGPIRGIPFYWRLIDCSFGLFGIIPLLYCLSLRGKIADSERKC